LGGLAVLSELGKALSANKLVGFPDPANRVLISAAR